MSAVQPNEAYRLIQVIQELSLARDLPAIVEIIRHAARELTGSDGATFVLRDGDKCYYVDEDAITPLWKGLRFPLEACVSGWAMLNKTNVVIPDIYKDSRVPVDAYRPTFVKSMVMIPIRRDNPIGAIGTYWATPHEATAHEVKILEALANSTSITLQNIQLLSDLTHQINMKDEFLAISAHELRTPLTPLSILLQLISRQLSNSSPEIQKALLDARNQLKEVNRMVDSLMDVSKIHMGEFSHVKKHTELGAVIKANVDLLRLGTTSEINLDISGPLWGNWDEERIGQMVRNLVLNAIKYGEGKPIEMKARNINGQAEFSITDHGIGILRADQSRIFRRFERAHTFKNYGGMGLGLFVVCKILEDHGGTISVQSEIGQGSTFVVKLPLLNEATLEGQGATF